MSAAGRAAAVAVGDDAIAWALSVGDDDWARAAGGVAWAFGIPLPRLAGSEAALVPSPAWVPTSAAAVAGPPCVCVHAVPPTLFSNGPSVSRRFELTCLFVSYLT